MRRVLILLALLPALALASGRMIRDGEVSRQGGAADRDPILMNFFPLTTNGAAIADDAGAVVHVVWDGSALVDVMGNAWTQNGTVPQVAANVSPFSPGKAGAGPYSALNYYTLGTGSDVLDFTTPFSVCLVYNPLSEAGSYTRLVGSAHDTVGWHLRHNAGYASIFSANGGVSLNAPTPETPNAINVFCAGYDGSKLAAKLNLGTYQLSGVISQPTSASGIASFIGRSNGGSFTTSTIYEFYATQTTPSDALFTAIQKRVFGQVYASISRTGSAVNTQNGRLWNTAGNVARTTADGWMLEPARTNYTLQSDQLTAGAGWTLTAVSADAVDAKDYGWGVNTMEQFTATGSPCNVVRTTTTPSSTGPFTSSAWVAAVSGTATVRVLLDCNGGAPTATECRRSDGGVCTTAVTGSTLEAYGVVGTTPIRMSVTGTCAPALTNPIVGGGPSAAAAACNIGDTLYMGGVQFEVGSYATSYIPTTTTSLIRNWDVAGIPNGLRDPKHFCVRSTIRPPPNAPWASVNGANGLFVGSSFFAPSLGNSTVAFTVYDQFSAYRQCANATALSLDTTHTFRDSMLDPGQIAQTLDGVTLPCTFAGPGTAIMARQISDLNLGTTGAGYGAGSLSIRDVQLYRSGVCR